MVRNDELTTINKWGTMGDDEGWWAMLACMMVGMKFLMHMVDDLC